VSKAGFVGLAGRPNVGKSTLVNAIVGSHVAIVSERPQTTRRAIRGVATDLAADWQLIMTDLPGVQRPRDALTERMQRRVEREIADSDAVLFVINAEQGVGPGDRFISKALLQSSIDTPVVCAVNKVDRLNNAETAAVLAAVGEIGGVDEIFPVSARKGHGLEPMIAKLIELLPESPFLFPPEQRSDLPSQVLLAELIREQVLRRTRDELPHAVEVQVSDVAYREDGVVEVHAHVWAETESQKGILIGSGGRKIKEIGTAARTELERELGGRVFLDLQVRVRKRWRQDESLLDRIGIE
jgi:GTP-binding protein Era